MAISFVSIRSQNSIMKSNKNNAKSKGETLTKLASGKNYNHPRDGISEFRNISTLKTSISQYNNLFKNISKLREKYESLKTKINDIATDFKINGGNTDQEYIRGKSTRQALQEEINVIINTIESTINNTDFLGEKTFQKTDRLNDDLNLTKTIHFSMSPHDDFDITVKNIDFASNITAYSGTYDDTENRYDGGTSDLKNLFSNDDLYKLFASKDSSVISDADMEKIQDAIKGAAEAQDLNEAKTAAQTAVNDTQLKNKLDGIITNVKAGGDKNDVVKAIRDFVRENSLSRTNILAAISATIDNVANNYQAELSAITNIDNSETLLTIQKNNIQAALSSIEDTDVQEEMMNLMNEEILEQLSSEALVKIKESSKYIVRLIQS